MDFRFFSFAAILILSRVFTAVSSILGYHSKLATGIFVLFLIILALIDPKLYTKRGRLTISIVKNKKNIFASEKNASAFAQKVLAKEYDTSTFLIIQDLSPGSAYGIHTTEIGIKYYIGKVVRKGDKTGCSEIFMNENGEWWDNVYINIFQSRIFSDLKTLFREHEKISTSSFFSCNCALDKYAKWKAGRNYAKFLAQAEFSTCAFLSMKEDLCISEYYEAIKNMLESIYKHPVAPYKTFRMHLAIYLCNQKADDMKDKISYPTIFYEDLQEYKDTFEASPMDLHSKICKAVILAEQSSDKYNRNRGKNI